MKSEFFRGVWEFLNPEFVHQKSKRLGIVFSTSSNPGKGMKAHYRAMLEKPASGGQVVFVLCGCEVMMVQLAIGPVFQKNPRKNGN